MTDAERIRAAEAFLKDKLQSGSYMKKHPDALAYRVEHSYRVANIGRTIASREGFDPTEMTVACLLHDVAYCEDFDPEAGWSNHGRRSAHIARPFLARLGFAPERVDDMCYGIAIHVDDRADFSGVRTPFAETISDADNIDRFDAYRIYEGLERQNFSRLPLPEKRAHVENTLAQLSRLRELPLATQTAKALWQERMDGYEAFYRRLLAQTDAGAQICSDADFTQKEREYHGGNDADDAAIPGDQRTE